MAYPTSDILESEVDNVDKVMAQHVNELRGASVNMTLRHIKNTSGATVAVGAVGYIDASAEFKITSTAYLVASWAVVIVGGANNADIVVAVGGSKVIVTCNGNAPVGYFLYTSSTSKQAQPLATMRSEMFAIVTKANTGGAGGTCEAVLHCDTRPRSARLTYDIYRGDNISVSDFVATIATLPGGAVLTYNAPSSGDEANLVPTSTNQYAKMVLQNSTRSNDALILNTVIGTNTITLTDDVPGTWQVGDTVTIRSATNTDVIGASRFVDFEVTSGLNALTRAISLRISFKDSGAAGHSVKTHPWKAGTSGERDSFYSPVTNQYIAISNGPLSLIQNRFCMIWDASGAGTLINSLRVQEEQVAKP